MNTLAVSSKYLVREAMAPVWDEARKKFDDAIYRTRTGETITAVQLWDELKDAQKETNDGLAAGRRRIGIYNQLERRGQISFRRR
jgi:hypothetical protein